MAKKKRPKTFLGAPTDRKAWVAWNARRMARLLKEKPRERFSDGWIDAQVRLLDRTT